MVSRLELGLDRVTKSERKDYWRRFLERLRKEGLLAMERAPYESTWQVIDEWSRHQIRLSARLNAEQHWIHIDLTFSGPNRYKHFDRLSGESGKIPSDIVATISDHAEKWERDHPDHPGECWIYWRRSADPMDTRERDTQHEWLAQALGVFRHVFGNHINGW
jgi:hypothetical protein